jgi:ubiquinone/menaquinone biosynthesis C-methylase UbiE
MSNAMKYSKREWEFLAESDPLWAILSAPEKKGNQWNQDEFFLTGEKEINFIMEKCRKLGFPKNFSSALDFGCGVGRLTQAIAKLFTKTTGLDIAEEMVVKAKNYAKQRSNNGDITFVANSAANLSLFPDNNFDFIYSDIVLQHVPSKTIIKGYIREMIRTLNKDGILVFQLLAKIPFKNRLQLRFRLFSLLMKLGIPANFLYQRLHLTPIRINSLAKQQVEAVVSDCQDAYCVQIEETTLSNNITSCRYFISKK